MKVKPHYSPNNTAVITTLQERLNFPLGLCRSMCW